MFFTDYVLENQSVDDKDICPEYPDDFEEAPEPEKTDDQWTQKELSNYFEICRSFLARADSIRIGI